MTDLVTATITRLAELKPSSLKLVAGLLSLNALTTPPTDKMPAAYVMMSDEAYGPNGRLNVVRQTGTEAVRIVLMIASKAPQGDDVFNPIAAPRAAVVAKLLGWQPDAEDGAVLLRSGAMIDVQATFLAYQLIFFRDHSVKA